MAKFLDRDHPMFRSTWVRVVAVGLPLAWSIVEFAGGSPGFGILFGALGVYALYELFLKGSGGPEK